MGEKKISAVGKNILLHFGNFSIFCQYVGRIETSDFFYL